MHDIADEQRCFKQSFAFADQVVNGHRAMLQRMKWQQKGHCNAADLHVNLTVLDTCLNACVQPADNTIKMLKQAWAVCTTLHKHDSLELQLQVVGSYHLHWQVCEELQMPCY